MPRTNSKRLRREKQVRPVRHARSTAVRGWSHYDDYDHKEFEDLFDEER